MSASVADPGLGGHSSPNARHSLHAYSANPAGMSHLSTSLRSESAKYRKAARQINIDALIRKWAPVGGIGFFFILFIWWRFF